MYLEDGFSIQIVILLHSMLHRDRNIFNMKFAVIIELIVCCDEVHKE